MMMMITPNSHARKKAKKRREVKVEYGNFFGDEEEEVDAD